MNKLMVLTAASLLCACASQEHKFLNDPDTYGLYVASLNFDQDAELTVQNAQTGESSILKARHINNSVLAYTSGSLTPGRYTLVSYVTNLGVTVPIGSTNGFFEVQAGCYNYGGAYDFETQADGTVSYTNTTRLKDIEQLPRTVRDPALGHDICGATMGKASERLAAADVANLLSL